MIDTLLGFAVPPFKKRLGRDVISKAAKFYLFDVGIAGFLIHRSLGEERGEAFGKAFEHFILMELTAYRSYRERDFNIQFWRTKSGLEVDFILGDGEVALEIKGTRQLDSRDLTPLKAFVEEARPKKALLVCNERAERIHGRIHILPWQHFLTQLWEGKII